MHSTDLDDQRAAVVMKWEEFEKARAAERSKRGTSEDGKAGGARQEKPPS